jgi:peptidoglycan/LPS O-acetylase OafA/YrhL
MSTWPFRSRLMKTLFVVSATIMALAAVSGLIAALAAGGFERYSIAAVTVGLGALLIIVGLVSAELVNRKFHPESALFRWADVDILRGLANTADDPAVRDWARSMAERVAVVLPRREVR